MLRFGELFAPAARAMVEMYYEFDRPFTVDSFHTERTLGLAPTPFDEQLFQDAFGALIRGIPEVNQATAPRQ